jgi:ribosomal protein L32
MIDQGRISTVDAVQALHKCEICGSEIKSGRLCLTCMKNEAAKLKTEFSEKKDSDRKGHSIGMRYFGKQNR